MPKHDVLLLAPFRKAAEACEAVSSIFHAGITPSGLEFMEKDALLFAQKHIPGIELEIADDVEAHLLIELDGNQMDQILNDAEKVFEVLGNFRL